MWCEVKENGSITKNKIMRRERSLEEKACRGNKTRDRKKKRLTRIT
jgi:hypothetical protein